MAEAVNYPVVAWCPANIDACALWRLYIPYVNTPNSRFVLSVHGMDKKMYEGVQVAVVQRLHSEANLMAIKVMKDWGIKIVYDLDDNLWAVQSSNPAYKFFKEVDHQFARCAMLADVMTVSTQGLKSAVQTAIGHTVPILICPNGYDPRFMFPAKMKRDDDVVIGWGGSNTHKKDVEHVWGMLEKILEKHPNVRMEFAGGNLPEHLRRHPRVRLREWVPVGAYFSHLMSWGWDIVLAPLEDNRFNRSKSNIKLLEASMMGAPCLVSDVQPYAEFCALGNTYLKWLLCKNPRDWETKISDLVVNKALRTEIVKEQLRVSRTFFTIDTLKNNWHHAIQQVLS